MPTKFLQKKSSIFPGFSKDTLKKLGFYIKEIKQKSEHFVQQPRCYKQSNKTYRFNEDWKFKKKKKKQKKKTKKKKKKKKKNILLSQ